MIADLADEVERRIADVEDLHRLVDKQAKLLTGAVNALRGTPPPLTLWSHHDVGEHATAMRARAELAEQRLAAVARILAHSRLVSPSESMTVYVTEVQAALDGAP
ncbi:MAG: hypothetical protein ACTHMS_23515 [Jatrophihabitans sp.]